eukprot:TRINITY_DN19802_c0_g1_i1.p1 TRINITY_DN19802_c0_g1~~TRINITY_DN19802_c0_g1_i1.p1  ORF type:complete len:241 (+),score=32.94 TRINITY_DN19802_c0_g1_i1:49-771(+)
MRSCGGMKSVVAIALILLGMLAPLGSVHIGGVSQNDKLNVMNQPLELCSTNGTAMTGFVRDGTCVDEGDDDQGSHHICIKMKSDFCKVTGQDNWCGEEMPCMEDETKKCRIGNWCVCQWAFAKYISLAGGCDKIVDVQCSATNMAARKKYEETQNDDPNVKAALECLKSKCKFSGQASTPSEQASTASKRTLTDSEHAPPPPEHAAKPSTACRHSCKGSTYGALIYLSVLVVRASLHRHD